MQKSSKEFVVTITRKYITNAASNVEEAKIFAKGFFLNEIENHMDDLLKNIKIEVREASTTT